MGILCLLLKIVLYGFIVYFLLQTFYKRDTNRTGLDFADEDFNECTLWYEQYLTGVTCVYWCQMCFTGVKCVLVVSNMFYWLKMYLPDVKCL